MKQFFRVLEVIKPEHSRLVNAERYVVFKDYSPNETAFNILKKLYSQYSEDDVCYFDIFDEHELEACAAFLKFQTFLHDISKQLIERATQGINMVVDLVNEKINNPQPKIHITFRDGRRPDYYDRRSYRNDRYADSYRSYDRDRYYGRREYRRAPWNDRN